jgi:hypothetical protein
MCLRPALLLPHDSAAAKAHRGLAAALSLLKIDERLQSSQMVLPLLTRIFLLAEPCAGLCCCRAMNSGYHPVSIVEWFLAEKAWDGAVGS